MGDPPDEPPSRFALWLLPPGDIQARFAEVIRSLSARFHTPRFEPHVTLVGGIAGPAEEVVARTEDLASSMRPLEVRLLTAHARPDYFQSLIVKVDPTRELMEAAGRARVVFGGPHASPYFPHLSLMYGDTPMEQKEALLRELGQDFGEVFTARMLEVVCLDGGPGQWRRMASFPFSERRKRPRSPRRA